MVTKPEKENILPKLTLLQRLAQVQRAVDYIQKEKKAGMKYSIVSHDAVTAKVRPLMVELGVLYYPAHIEMTLVGNRTQMTAIIRFVSIDDDKDYIDVYSAGYGIDEQDKGPGKAISYSVKYALLKALGLESGDDPDYDQETEHRDSTNPDLIALDDFKTAIEAAATKPELEAAYDRHKGAIEKAAQNHAGKVQSVRSAYKAKLFSFGKGETKKEEQA